jgi:hypothetical protein
MGIQSDSSEIQSKERFTAAIFSAPRRAVLMMYVGDLGACEKMTPF